MPTTYTYLPTKITIRSGRQSVTFRLPEVLNTSDEPIRSLDGLILRAVNLAEERFELGRDERLINYTVALRFCQ